MQKDKVLIREGHPADAGGIAEIEALCFAHPWSEADLLGGFDNCTRYVVAEMDGEILGYCGIQMVGGEGYITNVAVKPQHRKQGIGIKILEFLLNFSRTEGLEFVTLEVRESNLPAINLYKKMGFGEVGKRPNFYRDPKEDALLLTRFFNR